MSNEPGLEKCLTFINCQLRPGSAAMLPPRPAQSWRAVTISRQSGAGGHAVAEALAELLKTMRAPELRPWTVFDRNLVEKVLEDQHLPLQLAKFMPEDRVSEIEDAVEDLCGLHPPSATLVEKTAESIQRLAELGNVILIGRGAGIVTSKLNYVFHVRLVGSLEKRIAYVQAGQRIGRPAALKFIRLQDRGRRRYVKKYFDRNIEDPLLYHLIINTDHLGHSGAARIIAQSISSGPPN